MRKNVLSLAVQVRLAVFDFDGVFTDNRVIVDESGKESVVCNRSDGIGLSRLKKAGVDVMIISSEPNKVVLKRAAKLKVRCVNDCRDKLGVLKKEIFRSKITFKQVVYVGNDVNDSECLKKAGLPVVVRDAHKDVLRYAAYITRLKGGCGAVREVCDMICSAKGGGK